AHHTTRRCTARPHTSRRARRTKPHFLILSPPPRSTPFPYTTLFRSVSVPARAHCPPDSPPRTSSCCTPRRAVSCTTTTPRAARRDRKSTRLNSSHLGISYAVFCLKKKNDSEYQRRSIRDPRAAEHQS